MRGQGQGRAGLELGGLGQAGGAMWQRRKPGRRLQSWYQCGEERTQGRAELLSWADSGLADGVPLGADPEHGAAPCHWLAMPSGLELLGSPG